MTTTSLPSARRPEQHRPGDDWPRERRARRLVSRFLVYLLLLVVAVGCLIPFYGMLVDATHSSLFIASKFTLVPGGDLASNYHRLMSFINIWQGFAHSVIVAVLTTALTLYFSALGGYAFSRHRFRGQNILFGVVVASMMVPGELEIVGMFKLTMSLHLLNTYWPLILPAMANAFGIFFMKQMCDTLIPVEILAAARVDGARELTIFHRIVLPMLGPGVATLGVFVFISAWNSFLLPLILIFDDSKQTLPVMVELTQGQFNTDYGAQYVGVMISIVPILAVFAVASKKIISGVSFGGLKG
ncbi:carbohydrate ABC transporter permease [Phaeacidiphilus oryzae]|uniref:carbohydrate ABC transporter permease n=1 Tax=Phaeacidiphilus oryzae TaxID=348818 RepID=UPI000A0255B7|nr:carbohydrate ABC transporter permease [Phaeacidiphilus oryzae]